MTARAATAVLAAAAAGFGVATLLSRRRARARPAVGARVIFLDLDGVLNRTANARQVVLDAELVARLKAVCDAFGEGGRDGVQIVLSTFWRHFDDYIACATRARRFPVDLASYG